MKNFVSEAAFKKRVNYFGDWKRVQAYEKVAVDLDVTPFIGYANMAYLAPFIENDTFPNTTIKNFFDAYILDLTIYFMAYRAYPIIFRHLNNAGVTDPGESAVSKDEMYRVQNSFIQLANTVQGSLERYYGLNQAAIELPKSIGQFESKPYAQWNLDTTSAIDTDDIAYKVVPLVPVDSSFYWGLIATNTTLTKSIIEAGTPLTLQAIMQFSPNQLESTEVWFASTNTYVNWAVDNDSLNTSTLLQGNGLFNYELIDVYKSYRQNYLSSMGAFELTISQ
jgi:hypothetical protein